MGVTPSAWSRLSAEYRRKLATDLEISRTLDDPSVPSRVAADFQLGSPAGREQTAALLASVRQAGAISADHSGALLPSRLRHCLTWTREGVTHGFISGSFVEQSTPTDPGQSPDPIHISHGDRKG